MRFLFTSDRPSAPSTQINLPNYRRLSEIEGVTFAEYEQDYESYDVILFMGYAPDVAGARAANPAAKIGIIDPRPGCEVQVSNSDFVIVNGLEMQDWCAGYNQNVYTYPIYPYFQWKPVHHRVKPNLVIGYHGNKVHLQTMFPHAIAALKELNKTCKMELRAIYNVDQLGVIDPVLFDDAGITVHSIQWTDSVYEEQMPNMDIGIVPNLIPVPPAKGGTAPLSLYSRWYNEHASDRLLRYKNTSNAGRAFVFAQYGIPVVSDFTPSMGQVIRDGCNGFLAESAGAWYRAIKRLADSPELRQKMGERLCTDCRRDYSIEVLNSGLIKFIRELDDGPVGCPDFTVDWKIVEAQCVEQPSLGAQIKKWLWK